MIKPIITRRANGEYSTVILSNGVIETVWFPDDPGEPSRVIGRTYPHGITDEARRHIAAHEERR